MTGKIIWLASYPKSGNTWLRAFLGALIGHEVIDSRGSLAEFSLQCNARATFNAVFAGLPAPATDTLGWRLPFQDRLSDIATSQVFVKTHCRFDSETGTPLFSPQASSRAILVIRNPIDVCASLTNHFGVKTAVALDMINNPKAAMARGSERNFETPLGDWTSFNKSWLEQKQIPLTVIRYEDLFQSQRSIFAGIARDLFGIEDDVRIEAAIEQAQFGELKAREERYGFNEKPQRAERFFWKGRPYHGLELLDRQQQRLVWQKHGKLAQQLGYRYIDGKLETLPLETGETV